MGCAKFQRDRQVLLDIAELCGPENSWMNFSELTRKER